MYPVGHLKTYDNFMSEAKNSRRLSNIYLIIFVSRRMGIKSNYISKGLATGRPLETTLHKVQFNLLLIDLLDFA